MKIGQEFEQGTDTRGQTFNNWGGNGGQKTNQRQIISRNVERCKWCNRPEHTMSNCYARAKFEDERNVMELAPVAYIFVYNSGKQKWETKQERPTISAGKAGGSSSKHRVECIQTVRSSKIKRTVLNTSVLKFYKNELVFVDKSLIEILKLPMVSLASFNTIKQRTKAVFKSRGKKPDKVKANTNVF